MSVESEMLVERRLIGQRLGFWRTVAIVAGLIALLVMLSKGGPAAGKVGRNHIARVYISGIITDNAAQQKLLEDLQKADRVKAVVLRINSPGGTTTGGEALYLRIRDLAAKKPVVAVFGTVAASAAYMAAMGANHIVTRGSSITGSVGVIVQWPDVSAMMAKLGVTMEELKSGRLKATPTPFKHEREENLVPMKELVADTFDWFLNLVVKSRKLDLAKLPGLKEGRVYTGRQAVKLGLADEIGGEDEAVKWLVRVKKTGKDLPVVERKPESELIFSPFGAMLQAGLRRFGLERFSSLLSTGGGARQGASTGLMSLWQL